MRRTLFLVVFGLLACAKTPPGPKEFAAYKSPSGDFECLIPKGWTSETALDGDVYRFVTWVGPDDPKALWGAPRFVLTWHAAGKKFKKASGEPGKYDSIEDFVAQMGRNAWSPDPAYPEPLHAVLVGGRGAQRLTVRVQKDAYMSIPDARPVSQGGGRMWRKDTGVFVPTRGGFYTIVFPCAEDTSPRPPPAFEKLLESLRFLTDSPVG